MLLLYFYVSLPGSKNITEGLSEWVNCEGSKNFGLHVGEINESEIVNNDSMHCFIYVGY